MRAFLQSTPFLFSDHLCAAFWAFPVDAALSNLVRDAMATIRTETVAVWAGTGLGSPAASSASLPSTPSAAPATKQSIKHICLQNITVWCLVGFWISYKHAASL
jgi:hypothetical protein